MNSDTKFWLSIWSLSALTIIIIVIGALLYHNMRNTKIASAKNPIRVACALDADTRHLSPTCFAYINNENTK